MPKLLIAAVCETAILEQDGVASLIRLFNRVIGVVNPDLKIPENAVAPKDWSIFSVWEACPGDEGKEFTQCCELLYPDGKPFLNMANYKFVFQDEKRQQNIGKVNGFPIGQQGEYKLRIWLERNGETVSTSEPMILTVVHSKPEYPTATIPA